MIKSEIVSKIAKKTGMEIKEVSVVAEGFMDTIRSAMEGGENVYLRGFGTFSLKKRKEKKGRDIKRSQMIIIPEHYVPVFKPCKEFSNNVSTNVKSD